MKCDQVVSVIFGRIPFQTRQPAVRCPAAIPAPVPWCRIPFSGRCPRNGGTVFSVPLSANTGTACTVPAFFQISSVMAFQSFRIFSSSRAIRSFRAAFSISAGLGSGFPAADVSLVSGTFLLLLFAGLHFLEGICFPCFRAQLYGFVSIWE